MKRFLTSKLTKPVAVVAIVMLAASSAHAARIDARQLSCGQAISLVQSNGQVVMTLTNTTYDRIVKNRFFCSSHEVAKNVFTQTRDVSKCLIGKRCVLGDPLHKF